MDSYHNFSIDPVAMHRLLETSDIDAALADRQSAPVTADPTSYETTGAPSAGRLLPPEVHLAVGILMVVVGLIGTMGNCLVIFVFGWTTTSQMGVLLMNLAVADLLMAAFGTPLVATASFMHRWPFGHFMCQAYAFVMGSAGLAAIATNTAIALERVCAVAFFFSRPPFLRLGRVRTVSVIWLYSLVWTVPPLFGWNRYILEPYGTACSFDYLTRTASSRGFIVAIFVGGFVVPCTVIAASYALLAREIFAHERSFQRQVSRSYTSVSHGPQQQQQPKDQIERRVTKVCVVVVLFYCMAWLPYAIVVLHSAFSDTPPSHLLIYLLPGIFAKASSMYNPIIYSLSHPYFKKRLRQFLNPTSSEDRVFPTTYGFRHTGAGPNMATTAARHTSLKLEPAGAVKGRLVHNDECQVALITETSSKTTEVPVDGCSTTVGRHNLDASDDVLHASVEEHQD